MNLKVWKVRNNDTGLFKRSSGNRRYSFSDYWSKVGAVYASKGAATNALNNARERCPESDIQLVEFALVEVI